MLSLGHSLDLGEGREAREGLKLVWHGSTEQESTEPHRHGCHREAHADPRSITVGGDLMQLNSGFQQRHEDNNGPAVELLTRGLRRVRS